MTILTGARWDRILSPSNHILTIVSKGVDEEYQLIILHPSYFLVGGCPLVIKHPKTGEFTTFYGSEDGLLHEGSSTGDPLPPFKSRGRSPRAIPLNPILVNFAAVLRLRRLINEDHDFGSAFAAAATDVLKNVIKLHAAVVWDPESSHVNEFVTKYTHTSPPTYYDIRAWPEREVAEATPGTDDNPISKVMEAGRLPPFLPNCINSNWLPRFVKNFGMIPHTRSTRR